MCWCSVFSTCKPPASLERLRDDGQVRDPAVLPVGTYVGLQVGNVAARVVDAEGVELVAQESAARRPFRVADRDVLRQHDGRIRQLVNQDRAERRMAQRRIGTIARFQEVRPSLVVPLLRDERTDHAKRADLCGQLRERIGDLESADGRGDRFGRPADLRAGMGIPRFKLARSPFQPDRDQRFLACLAPLVGGPRHRGPAAGS